MTKIGKTSNSPKTNNSKRKEIPSKRKGKKPTKDFEKELEKAEKEPGK